MSLAIPHQFRKKESPISSTKVNENNSVIVSYINDLETSLLAGIYDLIPVGTKMVFYQAAAPAGWTLQTSVADKFLRIVAGGGGGTGGTVAASTSLAHTHTVAAHNHTGPSHTHTFTTSTDGAHTHSFTGGSTLAISGASVTIGSNGNHNHTGTSDSSGTAITGNTAPGTDSQLGVFAYADVIVCSKD